MDQFGRRRASGPLRSGWFCRTLGLRVGAVLGALCLLAAAAVVVLGLSPITHRSSSMAPAISSGDLSFARTVSAGSVGVGDVVSVTNRLGQRITHRVTLVEPYGSSIRLTLKADRSAVPDAETYEVTEVDRVAFSVPWLGLLVKPLDGLLAVVVGGLLIACLGLVVASPHRRGGGSRRSA
ncbi:signal peptidase I [Aeromicrobium stalagmiti]|uniref:signal peptidase I n=1 Tax=Aeromicrobium stalagmiti TaxID=2738988 RepID=UPI001569283F|nr:signal peptidase I [Aeromicrobium stalagmiti]NRQ50538.1 signal peptidase I [Aeromicrobium stalagmiti]